MLTSSVEIVGEIHVSSSELSAAVSIVSEEKPANYKSYNKAWESIDVGAVILSGSISVGGSEEVETEL